MALVAVTGLVLAGCSAAEPGADDGALRDCKVRLREARFAFRTQRAGGAGVRPEPVEATAGVVALGDEG